MDGILIIDKPEGITSHDVVNRVRRVLKTKRVGHTGTLDPFATGVMVILAGRATRLAQFLGADEKEYLATVKFGCETDTGDRTGTAKPARPARGSFSEADLRDVLAGFIGEIAQTPPMYSAKKVKGRKLYEMARQGVEIEREAVIVDIRELEVADRIASDVYVLRVVCSAGTYIRTLAEDIGRKLGTGAHLQELRRTRSGRFSIGRAVSIEELDAADDPAELLLPIQEAVAQLREFRLGGDRVSRTRDGMATRVAESRFADGEAVRMTDERGDLIAVGRYSEAENSIRPKVVLV